MAFETEAAKVQWPIEKRRDVDATYNPRTKTQLLAYAPGFRGSRFSMHQKSARARTLVLSELTAIRDLSDALQPHAAADTQGLPDVPLPERSRAVPAEALR